MAIAPNNNELIKQEVISIYIIGNIKHMWLRLHFPNRIEVKELLLIISPE
ncbi:MAG: hypothetical protein JWP71_2953 [Mucilaginibacter sp.]|nr:hypothetical protein [Mucilaginibacter sp.]